MRKSYDTALQAVLEHEGGYVNHPEDPGGATNRGVTQRVYDAWRKRQGLRSRAVKAIAADEVAAIYRAQYWDAVRGDDLPAGLDYAVFDFAVNSGPARAIHYLQANLGVTADGHIGLVTLGAAARAKPRQVIDDLCDSRLAFLKKLKTFPTFGKGWTRRVGLAATASKPVDPKSVRGRALAMAR